MYFNEEMETMVIHNRKQLQLDRLKATVHRVYNNEFYRGLFMKKGVRPEDIQTLEDIGKLPFLTKEHIREQYPKGLICVGEEDVVRYHASSGTSGKPTITAYTQNDIDAWADMIARSIMSAGGRKQDVLHNAYGYGLFTGGIGVHTGAEKLGISVIPVSTGNTSRQIMMIQDLQPSVIAATPSYMLHLGEVMEKEGIDPRSTSLKYGIFGAEAWSEEMRKQIEERFALKAVDIYGLSEVMGPGVAIECVEEQNGLHIQEDHFYVEVIDTETQEVLPDGEYGELVFTSLTKEAFPVIRYRTGDIASLKRGTCSCGRTTVKMSRPKGRVDDMLIIKGVNVFPSEVELSLLKVQELSPNYQLHVTRNGYVDDVELNVEITPELYKRINENINCEKVVKIIKLAERKIRNDCLINIKINVLKPGTLERSEGKAIRVVDKRMKCSS